MRSFAFPLLLLLLGGMTPAQACVPLVGTGQPGYPFNPPCMGGCPPAVLAAVGCPGFMVGAFAPVVPLPALAGHPMWLAIGFTAPLLPIPAPPLFPPYGPGLLGFALPAPLLLPAGFPPGPTFVPVPLPPLPPMGMVLTAHTIVLLGASIALSEGTGIII